MKVTVRGTDWIEFDGERVIVHKKLNGGDAYTHKVVDLDNIWRVEIVNRYTHRYIRVLAKDLEYEDPAIDGRVYGYMAEKSDPWLLEYEGTRLLDETMLALATRINEAVRTSESEA